MNTRKLQYIDTIYGLLYIILDQHSDESVINYLRDQQKVLSLGSSSLKVTIARHHVPQFVHLIPLSHHPLGAAILQVRGPLGGSGHVLPPLLDSQPLLLLEVVNGGPH